MTAAVAGNRITASLLNGLATPVVVTGTATAATNFSITSFVAYDAGGTTWFAVQATYSGSTITASSVGNITDTACCTLPFAPQSAMWLPYQVANTSDGVLLVSTAGLCSLLTLSPTGTIASGNIVNFSGTIATG
jgi:hypothetical protein